jgi:hypothetical protein
MEAQRGPPRGAAAARAASGDHDAREIARLIAEDLK